MTIDVATSTMKFTDLPMNLMDRTYLTKGAPIGLPPGLQLRAPPGLSLASQDNTCSGGPKKPQRLDLTKIEAASTVSTRSSVSSSDYSPLSVSSTNWTPRVQYTPDQTIIIFDWDDTLCPTSVCTQLADEGRELDKAAMSQLATEAARLIKYATSLADKVVIVTNAGEGWVEWSCAEWMPELWPTIQSIEVASARSKWEQLGITSPTEWKEMTFQEIIDQSFARHPCQNIKNIVCVGDAPYEHEALARVVSQEQLQGNWCRSKSVKFMIQPTIESLSNELRLLYEALEDICSKDEDMYINFLSESL